MAACVGGGSNAMGIFNAFLDDPEVRLFGFEAGGEGISSGRHAARFSGGEPGVLHGAKSYLLQDDDGQTLPSHSVSAGLDYPSVGPEHAWLHDIGRADYRPVTDVEAMEAFRILCRTEGIIPAIESAHALAGAIQLGAELSGVDRRRRPRAGAADQPVGARGQGRGHRRGVVRPDRGRARRAGRRGGAAVSAVAVRSQVGEHLDALGRAALIGYLPVGYPSVDGSVEAVRTMIDAGVDVVELGVPYSDPVMDGPTVQRAVDAALAGGTRVGDTIRAVEQVAGRGAPILVMTYWNLVLRYGVDAFARDLAAAGGAGLITPDLIPDEAADWLAASDAHGLDRVFLVAPSSTPERLASHRRRPRGASSTPPRPWASRGSGRRSATAPRSSSRTPGRPAPSTSASASASRVPSRPRRSPATPTASSSGSALVRTLLDAPDEAAGRDALAAPDGGPRRRACARRRRAPVSALLPLAIPSPSQGVWHLGPVPDPRVRARDPARHRRGALDDAAPLGRARRRPGHDPRDRVLGGAVRHRRRPDLPRDHLARRVLRRRAADPWRAL